MIDNKENEYNDIESSDQLSQMRDQVHLTNAQLIQIVLKPEQFIFKIRQFNSLGINLILNQSFKQALIYLQQAERLLQYGASCGKTIDRLLIIYTLQNQACAYQKLWQLQTSSNYMEAIIFNMNAYLQYAPTVIIDTQIFNTSSKSYINLSTLVCKRLKISFYYLQFSALSSQIDKHQVAFGSALNALSMLKSLCQQCYSYQKYTKQQNDYQKYKHIFKELSTIKQNVQVQKYDKYLLLAKKTVRKLKNKIIKSDRLDHKQFQKLKQFGIGQVMQVSIVYMNQIQIQPCLKQQISYINKIFKAIYISITFFTIATQLRLISIKKHDQNIRKTSNQFKKSQLYHLNSIIIAAKYLPCQTSYLNQILKSFYSHYNIDITSHQQQSQQTTHQTQFQNQGFMLTPRKYIKNLHDSQSPHTNTKFLTKLQSMTKIQEIQTEKAFPKNSLIPHKKKNKNIFKSKSKGQIHHSLTSHSHIKSIIKIKINRKSSPSKKKRKQVFKPKTRQNSKNQIIKKSPEKQKKKSQRKMKKSSSKDSQQQKRKQKSARSNSQRQNKSSGKQKNNKNRLRLKEAYFKKPLQKKKKDKDKISSSLSFYKTQLMNPLGIYSPNLVQAKNSIHPN